MRVAQRVRRARRATNLGSDDCIERRKHGSSDIWGDLSAVGQHIEIRARPAC